MCVIVVFLYQAMKTELAQLQIELAQYAEVAPALHAVASCYYPINGVAPLGSAALKAMGIASEELEAEVKSIQVRYLFCFSHFGFIH
jgi:hypothetical protein